MFACPIRHWIIFGTAALARSFSKSFACRLGEQAAAQRLRWGRQLPTWVGSPARLFQKCVCASRRLCPQCAEIAKAACTRDSSCAARTRAGLSPPIRACRSVRSGFPKLIPPEIEPPPRFGSRSRSWAPSAPACLAFRAVGREFAWAGGSAVLQQPQPSKQSIPRRLTNAEAQPAFRQLSGRCRQRPRSAQAHQDQSNPATSDVEAIF